MKDFIKGRCVFTLNDLMSATLEAGGCVNESMRELAYGVAKACLRPTGDREQAVSTVLLGAMFKTLRTPTEADDGKYELQLFAKDIYYLLQEYNWPMLIPDVEAILRIYEHHMGVNLLGGDENGDTPRSTMLREFTNFTLCREYEELFYKYDYISAAKSRLLKAYLTEDKTQVLAAGASLICAVSEICEADSEAEADTEAAHDLLFTCINILEVLNKWY